MSATCSICRNPRFTPPLTIQVKEDGKRFSIIRPLQDFECPYISVERYRQTAEGGVDTGGDYKIQLRKAFWDTALDKDFLGDEVTTNLVYIQAVEDVRLKHLDMTDEHREQLAQYRESGEKAKFVELCGEIPGYCFYRWKHVLIDYPDKDTKVRHISRSSNPRTFLTTSRAGDSVDWAVRTTDSK